MHQQASFLCRRVNFLSSRMQNLPKMRRGGLESVLSPAQKLSPSRPPALGRPCCRGSKSGKSCCFPEEEVTKLSLLTVLLRLVYCVCGTMSVPWEWWEPPHTILFSHTEMTITLCCRIPWIALRRSLGATASTLRPSSWESYCSTSVGRSQLCVMEVRCGGVR